MLQIIWLSDIRIFIFLMELYFLIHLSTFSRFEDRLLDNLGMMLEALQSCSNLLPLRLFINLYSCLLHLTESRVSHMVCKAIQLVLLAYLRFRLLYRYSFAKHIKTDTFWKRMFIIQMRVYFSFKHRGTKHLLVHLPYRNQTQAYVWFTPHQ